jgi:hypothetical protein
VPIAYIQDFAPPPVFMLTTMTPETILPAGPKHTPWAVQVVVEKRRRKVLRVEPVRKPRKTPWETSPGKRDRSREPTPPPQVHMPEPESHQGPPRWREPSPPLEEPAAPVAASLPPRQKGVRLVSAQNYAAVEAGQERYGLIDSGAPDSRTRSLILHVRKNRVPFQVLNYVRPGSVLHVRRPGRKGTTASAPLRVRFTTPARYYSPGCPVTTLAIAVDGADWQGLMTGTSPI